MVQDIINVLPWIAAGSGAPTACALRVSFTRALDLMSFYNVTLRLYVMHRIDSLIFCLFCIHNVLFLVCGYHDYYIIVPGCFHSYGFLGVKVACIVLFFFVLVHRVVFKFEFPIQCM